jgi:RNA-binding protein YhbY
MGKQGITDGFVEMLKNHFKKSKIIRISVLKSAGHDKEKIKGYSSEILEKLGANYVARVIGFTIVVQKFRKAVR